MTDPDMGVDPVDEREWLAERFETHRTHLRSVAYRMLGSASEADDAVQEAWIRLSRSGADDVENLGGWLTTVVSRVCLDMLRSRTARREDPLDLDAPVHDATPRETHPIDPEQEALLADALGPALLMVLETLAPAERLAFVLHDMFAVPFDEIADIVDRSPAATRQLASRARRRVQGSAADAPADRTRQRAVVDAFLAASRQGDFEALLALLDPDVVFRADAVAVKAGALEELRGAAAVAEGYLTRARAVQPALIDGLVGLTWAPRGHPKAVFDLTFVDDRIVAVELILDPDHIADLDVVLLDD
jgi:RNA polymerase sigma factor (sigma-70 family)